LIAISSDIGKYKECVGMEGGHSHSKPCNAIYSALAFAIVDWLLFSLTFFNVVRNVRKVEEDVREIEMSGGAK
jgi:hypothetical protein